MKISSEIIIQEDGTEVFHREFEVSDSVACVKSSYLISMPILRDDLNRFIFTNYHQQEDTISVGFEIQVKEDEKLIYEFVWTNLHGKKSRVYAALKGSSDYACDEILSYIKEL